MGTPPQFVSAADAMGASAERFQTDIHSFKGKMDVFTGSGNDTFELTSDMSFREPDSIYMKFDLPKLGELEVLLIDKIEYIGHDGDWGRIDLFAATGLDEYSKYKENKGPVSYSDVIAGLYGAHQLPNEVIDGHEYWHYEGTVDPAKEAQDLPDSVSQDVRDAVNSICAASFDTMIDPVTLLPRRYTFNMGFTDKGKTISILETMDFLEYNVDVDIPDAPLNPTEIALPKTPAPRSPTPRPSLATQANHPCELTTPTAVPSSTPGIQLPPTAH